MISLGVNRGRADWLTHRFTETDVPNGLTDRRRTRKRWPCAVVQYV